MEEEALSIGYEVEGSKEWQETSNANFAIRLNFMFSFPVSDRKHTYLPVMVALEKLLTAQHDMVVRGTNPVDSKIERQCENITKT